MLENDDITLAISRLPTILQNMNSILTQDDEGKPFLIVEDWHELGTIQRELNRIVSPEGLFDLDDVVDWGFSDEYTTCSNCSDVISMQPQYYGDITEFVILNNEILCSDCINESYEEEYIESVTNHPTNALKTTIISEDRLETLGWKQLKRKYENGLHQGQNDKPIDVFNKLKTKWDVLFTFQPSQFYIKFWAWIHEKEDR